MKLKFNPFFLSSSFFLLANCLYNKENTQSAAGWSVVDHTVLAAHGKRHSGPGMSEGFGLTADTFVSQRGAATSTSSPADGGRVFITLQ